MAVEYRERIVDSRIRELTEQMECVTVKCPDMSGFDTLVSLFTADKLRKSDVQGEEPDIIMRTMSLFESGESDGSISLSELFSGNTITSCTSSFTEKSVIKNMVRGGWPIALASGRTGSKDAKAFLDRLKDIDLIKPIAPVVGTTTSFSEVIRNMDKPISRLTADKRLDMLKDAMVVENVPSWILGVRPGDRLIVADKWFFTDPSLVAALLDVTPSALRNRRADLERIFSNLCIRDLRVYLTPLDGKMYHYFTRTRFEGGFIMELPDGRWASFMPCTDVSRHDSIAHDLGIIAKAESDRGKPVFSMIVTLEGDAYIRDDGIFVVPISCLRH